METLKEARKMIDGYARWLADNTELQQALDGWTEITTPFLDRHNDCLQIYLRREAEGGWTLTDFAYTIRNLSTAGIDAEAPQMRRFINEAIIGQGVRRDGEDICASARNSADLPDRLHALIQAMLAVDGIAEMERIRNERSVI